MFKGVLLFTDKILHDRRKCHHRKWLQGKRKPQSLSDQRCRGDNEVFLGELSCPWPGGRKRKWPPYPLHCCISIKMAEERFKMKQFSMASPAYLQWVHTEAFGLSLSWWQKGPMSGAILWPRQSPSGHQTDDYGSESWFPQHSVPLTWGQGHKCVKEVCHCVEPIASNVRRLFLNLLKNYNFSHFFWSIELKHTGRKV
jgi:hypothetical protein